ncbi:MAG: NADH-quinone oxidoreductase subunit NuoE [Candidatus Krumholzibacteriia bacterium]|nr:NADH-quinone oxidoreductase subunit NuoE [bacterium]MCB9513821.1 NADH-quinone oxidoreductase subunit NuoE [Candidatus Latescibacterota bacterium]MCB9515302.1 NADH-quinone oxidoreductase subunit NuoE [Candidatus Latescibacterota bacterium]
MFDASIQREADGIVALYPDPRSALLPLLHLVQREQGWVSPEAMRWVAERLELTPAMVEGVTTFYTMYNTRPVGKHLIQLCRTLSCELRGSLDIRAHLKARLGIGPGETSADGRFTLVEVECLGACGTAPAMMVGEDYHENLTSERVDAILSELG